MPRWVQGAVVAVLAVLVVGAGLFVYSRESVARLDGGFEQQVGFGGTRITYRTNVPCETSVKVSGEGTQARSFKNPKDGVTQKHTVMITELTPGRKYLAQVEFGDGPASDAWTLAAPVVRPFSRVKLEPRGEKDLGLSFITAVKAKTTAHAKVGDKDTDLTLSADPDVSHEGVFKGAVPARLAELSIEATDLEGDKRALSADQLMEQVSTPLAAAAASPDLAPAKIPDAVSALDKAGLGPILAELGDLGAWPFEAPDLSDERRHALYKALNALERALARATNVPEELGMLKVFTASAYLRGQIVTTGELAKSCTVPGKEPADKPVVMLVQLGLFSKLKPGLFTSPAAKTRVAYDPKPVAADASTTAKATVRLPAPPAGEYRSAQLAIAVSAIPRDAILVARVRGEPGEIVLWSPVGRPAPAPGEQWIARQVPPRIGVAATEVALSLEPVGDAKPAPLKVLGGLVIYR